MDDGRRTPNDLLIQDAVSPEDVQFGIETGDRTHIAVSKLNEPIHMHSKASFDARDAYRRPCILLANFKGWHESFEEDQNVYIAQCDVLVCSTFNCGGSRGWRRLTRYTSRFERFCIAKSSGPTLPALQRPPNGIY
jgi:hypothetical protein